MALAASGDYPGPAFDREAERELLRLANQERRKAGAAPLQLDEGLTLAARRHAAAMAGQAQLSHQFPGEPSLKLRLAAKSELLLDRAGENVSMDTSVEQAHQGLMLSAPHRDNLLNPEYNVAGFAAARNGNRLYIVQDFGHSLPTYPAEQAEARISRAVTGAREKAKLPSLQRVEEPRMREAACAMARNDRLATDFTNRALAVVGYTNLEPDVLPQGALHMVNQRPTRNFAVGTCYARTPTYPSGVYWVLLAFY
jgi:hypothetical protein